MPRQFLLALTCLTCGLALVIVLTSTPGVAVEQLVESGHPVADPHARPAQSQMSCTSCHACEKPTPEDPCLVTCPRHGGHFYGQHEEDEGPEIVIIDQLADLYGPVVFAHRLHAGMSNMSGGCENCHHYSETSGVIPPCRECHDETKGPVSLNKPALKGAYHRQCINCHLDWSHENACGFCHEQADHQAGAAPVDTTDIVGVLHPMIAAVPSYTYDTSYEKGPVVSFHHEDHVEQFGQKCVDCHQGDSCSRCHHGNEPARQQARLDHVKTCGACHAERDCDFCHNHQAKPKFEHTRTVGWALDPYHSGVECQTCHGSPQSFRTPSDRCTACHIHWEVGQFDHAVTGVILNDDHIDLECVDCHSGRDFSRTPSCTDCHDDAMLPDYLPGERVGRS
jgi:hypothetical protein